MDHPQQPLIPGKFSHKIVNLRKVVHLSNITDDSFSLNSASAFIDSHLSQNVFLIFLLFCLSFSPFLWMTHFIFLIMSKMVHIEIQFKIILTNSKRLKSMFLKRKEFFDETSHYFFDGRNCVISEIGRYLTVLFQFNFCARTAKALTAEL